ncbi:ArnT family glycosyltransferase [Rhodobacter maris]|uniref:4-amino-4-deoxy-L-arabinose transferase-like glycosyltransferase n=1 Tax=Rhodobacter maris TaxID=446682 RepID=A0A285RL83_9RHOB|nr:glycosyltransferase family 39 protein [Rhodobacter maris]SOB94871.1 4-amino-4-deoxy-L-arabinose transferase-like glycosyltransferase [Rhodobacter maris]
MSEAATPARGWVLPALLVVIAVVALRLVVLAFDSTDLFVDEAQYWLWGQRLDFGYYSKPPLIGWLLRAVTDLAGSSDPFWVRMPGAVLHGLTAMILGALGARIAGARAGVWAAVLYVTLPFVALGSWLISTDTVMAPFFALALLFFWRAGESRSAREGAMAGLALGLAFMAKYAALYFWGGAVLAMLLVPARWIGWRALGAMLGVFALVVAPNVVWNLTHKLTTLEHTLDNVGWVRAGAGANIASMAEFFGAQFVVFGPVTFVALLWGITRLGDPVKRALAALSILPLVAVTVQAFLGKAQANWAVAAYFAGTVLVVLVLPQRGRIAALALNLLACLAVPVLTIFAPALGPAEKPWMKRYLGRADLSTRVLDLARAEGVPVYAEDRDILADLFYTGRGLVGPGGVTVYAPQPGPRARNYYEQNFALPRDYRGKVLAVLPAPLTCGGGDLPPAGNLNGSGTWAGKGITPYIVDAECLHAAP